MLVATNIASYVDDDTLYTTYYDQIVSKNYSVEGKQKSDKNSLKAIQESCHFCVKC